LKQEYALLELVYPCFKLYKKKAQESQEELEVNGTHCQLIFADNNNYLDRNIKVIK
jgi:hypothetical protein